MNALVFLKLCFKNDNRLMFYLSSLDQTTKSFLKLSRLQWALLMPCYAVDRLATWSAHQSSHVEKRWNSIV